MVRCSNDNCSRKARHTVTLRRSQAFGLRMSWDYCCQCLLREMLRDCGHPENYPADTDTADQSGLEKEA